MLIGKRFMIFELCLIISLIALGTYEGQSVVGSIPTVLGGVWAYKRSEFLIGNRQSIYYERLYIIAIVIMMIKLIPLFLALGLLWAIIYVVAMLSMTRYFY